MSAFEGFVGKSYLAQSPSASAEETINLLLEANAAPNAKAPFTFYRSPGLKTVFNSGKASPVRGMLPLDGHVFAVIGDTLYDLLPGGVIHASFGPLANDGLSVSMAASPTQLVLVSANVVYMDFGGVLSTINWFGEDVTSVGFINTYFVFLAVAGDRFFYSEPGDATQGTPLNFASAEASANKYICMIVDREEIWLFGSLISQVFFDNSANDPNNPFLPNLSAVVPQGTVAAGSPIVFSNQIGWLSKSKSGQGIAWVTRGGYVPFRISNHAVEYQWSTYSTMADALSWTAIIKGHSLWRIYFPSADVTWEYDFTVDDWRKVLSYDPVAGQYHAHRGRIACDEFGGVLVGDRANGKIYSMSLDYMDDDGTRIVWKRRSPILTNENKRTGFPWFELDIQPGVGDGSNLDPTLGTVTPEADPQIELRFSSDWAQNFSNGRSRSMGKIGEFRKRVYWTRAGFGRQAVFEITGSASVKTVINSAYGKQPSLRTN